MITVTARQASDPALQGSATSAGEPTLPASADTPLPASAATTGTGTGTGTHPSERASVQISLSQAGQDYLARSAARPTTQTSSQIALDRLDALIRRSHTDAREQAAQRVSLLAAQMRTLMQMQALMSPKALAQDIALLAHQLAAAVAQYTQGGGSGEADTTPSAPPADTTQAAPTATTATATANDGQQTETLSTPLGGKTGTSSAATTQDFAQAVRVLAGQMKAALHASKHALTKQAAASESENTQNILDAIDQSTNTL